jgi:serine/threonine protein kinase
MKARSEREIEMIEREKKVLLMLNHPRIVKLLEIIEDEDKQITYLVFEYVSGGELFSYIVSHGRLTELVARKFVRQVRFSGQRRKLSKRSSLLGRDSRGDIMSLMLLYLDSISARVLSLQPYRSPRSEARKFAVG